MLRVPKLSSCTTLQYLQKNMGGEVDFLPADKHKIFLQVVSVILGARSQACPKYPK